MSRVTKVMVTIAAIGLATAAFAGVASAHEQSKKQYLKQGNAVCKAANKELDTFFGELFKDFTQDQVPTAEQQRQAADGAIPIFSKALDDVEALEGPPALDKKVDKLLDQYRAVVEKIDADPSIVFSENSQDPFAKLDKQAKKLGLQQCGQNT